MTSLVKSHIVARLHRMVYHTKNKIYLADNCDHWRSLLIHLPIYLRWAMIIILNDHTVTMRLIFHDCRMIVHDSLYDCTQLNLLIVQYNAFNGNLCHGLCRFAIKCRFSNIRTMALWLSIRLCYEQWYDYSWSIIWLSKISYDSEKIDADLSCDICTVIDK